MIGAMHQGDEESDQNMKRKLSLAGEIVLFLTVAGDKISGGDNLFKKYNQFGTCIENQVPC